MEICISLISTSKSGGIGEVMSVWPPWGSDRQFSSFYGGFATPSYRSLSTQLRYRPEAGYYTIFYSSLPNGAGGGLSSSIRLSSDDLNSVFCWHCSVLEQNNPNLEAGVRTQPPSNITQWVYKTRYFSKKCKKILIFNSVLCSRALIALIQNSGRCAK